MAMKRLWKGRPRGLSELPTAISGATKYQDGDVFLDRAQQSSNGQWFKLTFENGRVDFWERTGADSWALNLEGPSLVQLTEAFVPPATPKYDTNADDGPNYGAAEPSDGSDPDLGINDNVDH